MQDDDKYSPPEASLGDHAHTLARAGVGSIPLAGAAATELFEKLIAPPLDKRRQEWMESVAEGLRQLEEQQRLAERRPNYRRRGRRVPFYGDG